MSDPVISMSNSSARDQFSRIWIAIEYGSSPVEHGIDQIRSVPPGRRVRVISGRMPRTRASNW